MSEAPTMPPDVTIADLTIDPYPIYDRLHRSGPVHWSEELGRYFVTGYEASRQVELDPVTFSSRVPGSLQERAMGTSMIRKDGPEHQAERRSYGRTLKAKTLTLDWDAVFAKTTHEAVERYRAIGSGADFKADFATPLAGENLRRLIGFENATADDVGGWSSGLTDGASNYENDSAVWERANAVSLEIETAIEEMRRRRLKEPDGRLVSHVVNSGLPIETQNANLKLALAGGIQRAARSDGQQGTCPLDPSGPAGVHSAR